MPHADTLLVLLGDLVVIILAARLFGAIARRLGQPSVIGEVVAGILLGPTALGRIWPAGPEILFPKFVPLKEIADLGLVFFMFLVGLELDTDLMRKEGRRAFQISLSGVLAPFGLGMVLAYFLVPVNNAGVFQEGTAHPPSNFAFAMFLGASMCVTAFPILARIMVETGLYKTRVGIVSLCAAAVDDAIAWILLAAVIGIAKNGSPAQAVPALLLTLLFVGFMMTAGRRLLGLVARRFDVVGHLSVDLVAIVLVGVLASAFVTEKIGIHAIFGAFIFGAIMPKRSGMIRALSEKVEDFTVIVLLPIFFAVTGLRTNLLSLNSPALLGWTALILAVATLGKFAGTGIAARLTGSSARDSVIVGALMNTRGLTELVILSIGLGLGVLSDVTFAMMVIMALSTTVMAAPIVNRLVSRDELMGDLVGPSHAGAGEPTARVLVAVGNPVNAPQLVDAALRTTGGRRPAELLLVRLIPTPRAPEFSSGLLDVETQVAAAVDSMRSLVELASKVGVVARPISFLTDDVGADLARIAADQECELILLGWHRASLATEVIQALVRRVFLRAPCDVAVFVDRAGIGIVADAGRPVLLDATGTPGGPADDLATRLAAGMAAPLHILEDPARLASAARSPEALSISSDGDRLAAFARESALASVVIIPIGEDWASVPDFGTEGDRAVGLAACPAIVLRPAPPPGGRLA